MPITWDANGVTFNINGGESFQSAPAFNSQFDYSHTQGRTEFGLSTYTNYYNTKSQPEFWTIRAQWYDFLYGYIFVAVDGIAVAFAGSDRTDGTSSGDMLEYSIYFMVPPNSYWTLYGSAQIISYFKIESLY